jgi:mitochondrial translocator assembly and maintenance protein 41
VNFGVLQSVFPAMDGMLGYGSGVFPQPWREAAGSGGSGGLGASGASGALAPMVDMIFAVEDPLAWHRENWERHREHYAGLGHLGPRVVSVLQEGFGAGLWYNTHVAVPSAAVLGGGQERPRMKYGVIATRALVADLTQWTTLYASGRLHKPVRWVRQTPDLAAAAATNHAHALRAARLLLPARFPLDSLWHAIARISYGGDWRMTVGENPRKVEKIVEGSRAHFLRTYRSALEADLGRTLFADLPEAGYEDSGNRWAIVEQDMSLPTRLSLLSSLPAWIHHDLVRRYRASRPHAERDVAHGVASLHTALRAVAAQSPPATARLLADALANRVGRYARSQSLKGFASAGPARSWAYVAEKLAKWTRR